MQTVQLGLRRATEQGQMSAREATKVRKVAERLREKINISEVQSALGALAGTAERKDSVESVEAAIRACNNKAGDAYLR